MHWGRRQGRRCVVLNRCLRSSHNNLQNSTDKIYQLCVHLAWLSGLRMAMVFPRRNWCLRRRGVASEPLAACQEASNNGYCFKKHMWGAHLSRHGFAWSHHSNSRQSKASALLQLRTQDAGPSCMTAPTAFLGGCTGTLGSWGFEGAGNPAT